MVESVLAPDDYIVVFKLEYPSGSFIPALATPFNIIYSKKDLDTNGYEWHISLSRYGGTRSIRIGLMLKAGRLLQVIT